MILISKLRMKSYFSYDITSVKIKGFLWHGTETESDLYKCYIIWVNQATLYTQTFFSSAFINNQYYMRIVSSEKVSI